MTISDEMVYRAMAVAVREGLLPQTAPTDDYLANVEKIRRILTAALAGVADLD
jgi:hypothetical protein